MNTTGTDLSRISEQRKTPEGWFMTITRMERSNGLVISEEEKKQAVKYLSETQGITPEESKPYRYILEQVPNVQETVENELFADSCTRCHSAARVGLQKRTKNEWNHLIDFHLSYFPSIEYQAKARDRDWLKIAKEEVVPYLEKTYSFDQDKWSTWQAQMPKDIDTSWILSGHTLGEGDFTGSINLEKIENGEYSLSFNGQYLDGRIVEGKGKATLYSGYELRATLNINGKPFNQVIAIDSKNKTLKGRMFEKIHPEEGSTIEGLSLVSTKTEVLSVLPQAIKAGTSSTITIVGNNLDGKIILPKGVSLKKTVSKDKNKIVLSVVVSEKVKTNIGNISIGKYVAKNSLTIYTKVDSLKITPSYAIARVGDGGGLSAKQHAVFEAHGFNAGPDNKIETEDDISLGVIAASWSVKPFDERAEKDNDVLYAGSIDVHSGRFTPSFAGLNPKREFSTNNAGNLNVVASYFNGEETIESKSHLIVTVQSWIKAPIQ
jgi:quinohemoprotein amine dehydrogenase